MAPRTVRGLWDSLYERTAKVLPPKVAANMDLRRPRLQHSWGGPMNGQLVRQAIVRDICRAIQFSAVVETGTYRGTSTEFFANLTGAPVYSVEATGRYYEYSKRRFHALSEVHVVFGDSRAFLRDVQLDRTAAVLFYLDAHWHDDLPLADELRIICDRQLQGVIIVDDFEVPFDKNYTFDDYGPGRRLTASYLPEMPGWTLFYPSSPASSETGSRRGSAILASERYSGAVGGLELLRAAT